MKIEHVAIWVSDIETVAAFYHRHFRTEIGPLYENPVKRFRSRFLSFESGARLELMSRGDIWNRPDEAFGYAHIAVSVGSVSAVDELTASIVSAGHRCLDGPRWTGDGYYESVVEDPEGNRVEITI